MKKKVGEPVVVKCKPEPDDSTVTDVLWTFNGEEIHSGQQKYVQLFSSYFFSNRDKTVTFCVALFCETFSFFFFFSIRDEAKLCSIVFSFCLLKMKHVQLFSLFVY